MNTLEIVRSRIQHRQRTSRAEMIEILTALAADGLQLDNDCAHDSCAEAWTNRCKGITCASVLPSGAIPHGQVRLR